MTIRLSKRPSDITKQRTKELHKKSTKPEQILWSILQARKLGGLKFRRQHPIEPFIVDFYCSEARLVIEVDGQSHDGQEIYDTQRADFLCLHGLTIMRIANDDVLHNIQGIAEAIQKAAFTKLGKSLP